MAIRPQNPVAVSDNESIVAAFSPAVGTVSLTANNPGTATITVSVDDGRGGSAQAAFTVTVQPPVQPTEPHRDGTAGCHRPAAARRSI